MGAYCSGMRSRTVGGGLLPIAVCQLTDRVLAHPHREQAPSHSWIYAAPVIGAGRGAVGNALAYAWQTRNTVSSANRAATTCNPTGKPFAANPHGTDAAGCWVRLKG